MMATGALVFRHKTWRSLNSGKCDLAEAEHTPEFFQVYKEQSGVPQWPNVTARFHDDSRGESHHCLFEHHDHVAGMR